MRVCIGGGGGSEGARDRSLRETVGCALERAGHTAAWCAAADYAEREAALAGANALVLLPPDDLESATRGTYEWLAAAQNAKAPGVERVILLSTLDFFRRLPANWKLTTSWRPRPNPNDAGELDCWLAEISARTATHNTHLSTHCLRLGGNLRADEVAQAVTAAVERPRNAERAYDWILEHVGEAAERPDEDRRPWAEVLAPSDPVPASRPVRNVVIFGAGGPLGAAVAEELASSYRLRLTDARPLDEIRRENKPQSKGAPLPPPLEELPASPYGPHESRIVDVRDEDAVRDACAGMDAIINLSVVRYEPSDSFLVNTLGAIYMARAAREQGIRRLVQTGPQQVTMIGSGDYTWDYEVPSEAPPRPGFNLYAHSKLLAQEALRAFAEWHGLEVPNLLFSSFTNPSVERGFFPMIVSWADAARAIRAALEVPSLPTPYESFNIATNIPHGRFTNDKARRVLGWEPRDGLERLWQTGCSPT